jgi:hypothetical protein
VLEFLQRLYSESSGLSRLLITDVSELAAPIHAYKTVSAITTIIIIIGKTTLFEPQPSLQDSARLRLVFTSLDFATIFF